MTLNIVTIGSHSSLQILHGAKKEGFGTVAVLPKGREEFYSQFSFIDKVLTYKDEDEALELINSVENGVLIPHGSLVEYIGSERVAKIKLPIFGNRFLFEHEADQKKKMALLKEAGIKVPEQFEDPDDVDRLAIVKLPGAKGGRGYFISNDRSFIKSKLEEYIKKNIINSVDDVIIQEYVVGVPMYFQFFNSVMMNRLELTGIDIRYETNVDGLRRVPSEYLSGYEPTFVVVGNIPAVARESLLPRAYQYAKSFVETVGKKVPPGMIGPFCLESVVTDQGEIVVFEFSGRIVAGTNLYIDGSPYSWLYWDEPMSVG
ncbi:MAG: formate--phosphoribosylaminoimidazolecarboxamide ligase, partial [Thermoprotei archaeon]